MFKQNVLTLMDTSHGVRIQLTNFQRFSCLPGPHPTDQRYCHANNFRCEDERHLRVRFRLQPERQHHPAVQLGRHVEPCGANLQWVIHSSLRQHSQIMLVQWSLVYPGCSYPETPLSGRFVSETKKTQRKIAPFNRKSVFPEPVSVYCVLWRFYLISCTCSNTMSSFREVAVVRFELKITTYLIVVSYIFI